MIEPKYTSVKIEQKIGKPVMDVKSVVGKPARRRQSEMRMLPSIIKPLEVKVNIFAIIPQPDPLSKVNSRSGSQLHENKQLIEKVIVVPRVVKKSDRGGSGFSQNMFQVAMIKHQRHFGQSPRKQEYKLSTKRVSQMEAKLEKVNNSKKEFLSMATRHN